MSSLLGPDGASTIYRGGGEGVQMASGDGPKSSSTTSGLLVTTGTGKRLSRRTKSSLYVSFQ